MMDQVADDPVADPGDCDAGSIGPSPPGVPEDMVVFSGVAGRAQRRAIPAGHADAAGATVMNVAPIDGVLPATRDRDGRVAHVADRAADDLAVAAAADPHGDAPAGVHREALKANVAHVGCPQEPLAHREQRRGEVGC